MRFTPGTRILVIVAHPDDEVLGMGATLAKARSKESIISVVFLGEGVSARFPFGQYDSKEFSHQSEVRIKGACAALKILGIEDTHFYNRLCGQFDKYPLISIVKDIESHIDRFRPDILFTHNPAEVNVDHRISYQAVEVACRPARAQTPSEIYTFEIVCSGSWTFDTTFKPNVYVDVTKYWGQKMEAWKQYVGENRPFPFPRSDKGLETLAHYRGMASGLQKAEAFRLIREIQEP